MNQKTMEEAIQATLAEMRAMSPEELHTEIVKHRNSDLAELFRIAREFDDNFMRFPPRGASSNCQIKLSAEKNILPDRVTKEMVEN